MSPGTPASYWEQYGQVVIYFWSRQVTEPIFWWQGRRRVTWNGLPPFSEAAPVPGTVGATTGGKAA